jgi:hypothetical protein
MPHISSQAVVELRSANVAAHAALQLLRTGAVADAAQSLRRAVHLLEAVVAESRSPARQPKRKRIFRSRSRVR